MSRRGSRSPTLRGSTLLIPRMADESTRLFAAAFRAYGVDAQPTPQSDAHTRELGGRHTAGDECDPLKVTVGDLLRGLESCDVAPERVVCFMPTAEGPCRFGQYATSLRRVLDRSGYGSVRILSPSSTDGYEALATLGRGVFRTLWRALVAADLLRKLLLRIRPYEAEPGATDRAFERCLDALELTLETGPRRGAAQLRGLQGALEASRGRLMAIPVREEAARPLIAVVGEIFCRLNAYANDHVVRRLERAGAECWMTDIGEWVAYTRSQQARQLRLDGRGVSLEALRARLQTEAQQRDAHALEGVVAAELGDREEPPLDEVLEAAEPYLPAHAISGEMVLNVGRTVCLARRGVDGVVDISPFTCMNGIVSEAIYPRVAADCGGLPVRVLYFDGPRPDLDQELEVFLALCRARRTRSGQATAASSAVPSPSS